MLPLVIRSGSGILGSDDIKTRKVDQLTIDNDNEKDVDKDNSNDNDKDNDNDNENDNDNDNDNDIQMEGCDQWRTGSLLASCSF